MGFEEIVLRLGGDPVKVAQSAGLDLSQSYNPETRIPTSTMTDILNHAAQETGCDHFGLD